MEFIHNHGAIGRWRMGVSSASAEVDQSSLDLFFKVMVGRKCTFSLSVENKYVADTGLDGRANGATRRRVDAVALREGS